MKPIAKLMLGLIAWVILLAAGSMLGAARAQPASAPASSPVIPAGVTTNSKCGERATGMRADNQQVVTHQAEGQYVNAAGMWANCPPAAAPVIPAGVTTNSKCGERATGMRRDDRKVVEYQAEGQYVDAFGVWSACPFVPPLKAPPRDCGATGRFIEWSVGAYSCTTFQPDATSSTHPARSQGAKHGQTEYHTQWLGNRRGDFMQRCDNGVMKVEGVPTCGPAPGINEGDCDTLVQTSAKRCGFNWDGRRYPVASGASVTVNDVQARQGSATFLCTNTKWSVVSVKCGR